MLQRLKWITTHVLLDDHINMEYVYVHSEKFKFTFNRMFYLCPFTHLVIPAFLFIEQYYEEDSILLDH